MTLSNCRYIGIGKYAQSIDCAFFVFQRLKAVALDIGFREYFGGNFFD